MLAVILLGMTTRWATPLAAKIVLVIGPMVFYMLAFGRGPQGHLLLRQAFHRDEDVHFLHLLAGVFALAVVAMAIISSIRPRLTRVESPSIEGGFVDMAPWRFVWHMSALVVLATLGCYYWLAQ